MDVALLVVRVLLAAVFAVAGAAKLADLPGSRRAAAAFGVPPALVPFVGTALPVVELAVAVLLLPAATAVWGALGAFVLLTAFSVAIARSVARGEAPDCHCFGQLHSEPAGWPTLARNGLLALGAAFVVVAGWDDAGSSAFAWLGRVHGAAVGTVIVGAVAVGTAVACGYVWASNRELWHRVQRLERDGPAHGPPPGSVAPSFSLGDLAGGRHTLKRLVAAGKPVLLVFVDPLCGPCSALLPEVGRWQREHADTLTVAVLSTGKPDDVREKVAEHVNGLVLLDRRRKAYRAYDVDGTPSGVLVSPAGRVDGPAAGGALAIHQLVKERFGISMILGLPLGAELPRVTLPELGGDDVELTSLRGRETLLLFWSPDGEEAQALRDEVNAWEAEGDPDPALVVIAPANPDTLREGEFGSRVLVDRMGDAWYSFGGYELPFAVLIGADGRIAWPLAAGSEHILRLLRSSAPAPAPA